MNRGCGGKTKDSILPGERKGRELTGKGNVASTANLNTKERATVAESGAVFFN